MDADFLLEHLEKKASVHRVICSSVWIISNHGNVNCQGAILNSFLCFALVFTALLNILSTFEISTVNSCVVFIPGRFVDRREGACARSLN